MTPPAAGGPAPAGRSPARETARVLLLLVLFLVLALLMHRPEVHRLLDPERLRAVLRDDSTPWRAAGSRLLLVAGGGTLIGLGLPRLWIALLAGGLYGAAQGAVLAVLAALWGSVQAFLLGGRLLRAAVEQRLGGRLARWRDRLREDPFWWVLAMRLFPVSNAMLASALCGACTVPWRPFLLASLLGLLPQAVAFAAFGSGGVKGNPWQVLLGGGLLLLALLARRWLPRRHPPRLPEEDPDA